MRGKVVTVVDENNAMTDKSCGRCRDILPVNKFSVDKSRRTGYSSWCHTCKSEYGSAYVETHRQEHNLTSKTGIRKTRNLVLTHYGGKCVCCGEAEYRFLAIDHKDGGGTKHKKEVGRGHSFLLWIIRNDFPNSLQLLCHNCNMAKGSFGVCPHAEQRLAQEGI